MTFLIFLRDDCPIHHIESCEDDTDLDGIRREPLEIFRMLEPVDDDGQAEQADADTNEPARLEDVV